MKENINNNLEKYKEIYEAYKDKVDLACQCISSNPCSNVSEYLGEIVTSFESLISSLSDWNDSIKSTFVQNVNLCANRINDIKESVDTNWKNSEELYQLILTLLDELYKNYVSLEQKINSEPNRMSYLHQETLLDGTISQSYPGYESAYNDWTSECNKLDYLCSDLYSSIIENKAKLNKINEITISLDKNLNYLYSAATTPNVDDSNKSTDTNSTSVSSDSSIYKTAPVSGFSDGSVSFGLTTGNQTYDLSESELNTLYAIVASEAAHNPDDALGVMSVILNRVESNENFLGGSNPTPLSIATAQNQFEGYFGGSYRRYLNNSGQYIGDSVISQAVDDALSGYRNTNAKYFLANYCSYYSNNMITSDGNRYKATWES